MTICDKTIQCVPRKPLLTNEKTKGSLQPEISSSCHPGKSMTIYDLPWVAREASTKANTPINVISDFKKAGIVPFNRHAFEEHKFVPVLAIDLSHPELTAKNDKSITLIVDAVA